MQTIFSFFGILYPTTAFLLVILFLVYHYLKSMQKSFKTFNKVLITSIAIYIITFLANYPFGYFLILWIVRDFLVFLLIFLIWKRIYKSWYLAFPYIAGIAFLFGLLIYVQLPTKEIRAKPEKISFDPNAELIVGLKNIADYSKLQRFLEQFNVNMSPAFPQIKDTLNPMAQTYFMVDVQDTAKATIAKLIADINNSGFVDWVETNDLITLSPIESLESTSISKDFNTNSLNDKYISKLWGFNYMNIEPLIIFLKENKPKKKAKIFILDTGIDGSHEDIATNYESLDSTYDFDTNIHGTHCAGIANAISNNGIGIASLNLTGNLTTTTSITVLPGGSGTQESVIDGIILAADNGADVISMSLGGTSTESRQKVYEEAIKYATDKGAIVVVAAGNESDNALNHVPANCKGVITVSAVDENLQIASFSNKVDKIAMKLAAPGVNIYSTVPNGGYKYLNGTSMATPYVAGLLGIMKAYKPELKTEEAYQILNSTGIDTKNTAQTGKFIQPLQAITKTCEKTPAEKFQELLRKFLETKNF